ncbi:Protein dom-3, putative [Brugia malayi]|uniref:Decapping nuclease n=1 Tax=Brugia malayi TaxID=6279 RepID=A0A0K0JE75_BRUMA|nr:Protein dom-3, putative [Brugia malayi]CRZ24685.1 Bm4341 [Brugia malayi]VIO97350.1 Protein dom-3, putative [Brugia malayi]
MESLLKTDPSLYEGAFPSFHKPSVIGEMCLTKQHDVLPGRCRAKYLYEKAIGQRCNFDLNIGYYQFEGKDILHNEKLDVLLKWILIHSEPGSSLDKVCHSADFICWRGTLTRIACSPYEYRDGWRLAAVRYKSVIFICEFPTNEKILQLKSMSDRDKRMTYWGFKFEQYMTSDSLSKEPNINEPVTNLEEFDVVVKARLGGRKEGFRILYSGETDCIDADGEYVELKTQCKELTNNFWKHKAMKWWVQSFLIGIENIVVGYRDNDGMVTHTERLKVSQLTKKAHQWSASVTFNFLYATLSRLKKMLEVSPDLIYYVLEFDPSKRCITYQKSPPASAFSFLPDWFLVHFDKS